MWLSSVCPIISLTSVINRPVLLIICSVCDNISFPCLQFNSASLSLYLYVHSPTSDGCRFCHLRWLLTWWSLALLFRAISLSPACPSFCTFLAESRPPLLPPILPLNPKESLERQKCQIPTIPTISNYSYGDSVVCLRNKNNCTNTCTDLAKNLIICTERACRG